jgi:hypothetical protein
MGFTFGLPENKQKSVKSKANLNRDQFHPNKQKSYKGELHRMGEKRGMKCQEKI